MANRNYRNGIRYSLLISLMLASLVIVPLLFELYTFYLYTINTPDFFTFSGLRLWVFVMYHIGLGGVLGRFLPNKFLIPAVGLSVSVLISLLYQFCDPRQCYYSGPDGAGWIRLWTLLFLTASFGLLMGRKSLSTIEQNNRLAIFFGTITSLFLGYYPTALLYGVFNTYSLTIFLLVYAATIPFLFGGAVISMFSAKRLYAIYSGILSSFILLFLFLGLQVTNLLPFLIIPSGALSGLIGYSVARKVLRHEILLTREKRQTVLFALIIANFSVLAIHPYIDAPMNLSIDTYSYTKLALPTYYDAAFHNDKYFPTKRVEVEIDFENFDSNKIQEGNFLSAGIGAQSPNCCKDGLDYGYRADILLAGKEERYLVARAWEACDHNVGCSGDTWQLRIHQAVVPFLHDSKKLIIGMGWEDGSVNWYYKTDNADWLTYSSFMTPKIQNHAFNIGVFDRIGPHGPISNPPSGSAYFYQFGIAMSDRIVDDKSTITFRCPAYYLEGSKHCVTNMDTIKNGGSHWKVIWKWGVPSDVAIDIDEEKSIVVFKFGN